MDSPVVPKWLRSLRTDISATRLLTLGVERIVDASFRAAAGPIPSGEGIAGSIKWLPGMKSRLANLPRKAGLEDKDLAGPAGLVGPTLSSAINPSVVGRETDDGDPIELLASTGFAPTTPTASPTDPLSTTWHSPQGLLRLAHKQLVDECSAAHVLPRDREALVAVGIAVLGLFAQTGCELCPRWAVPGRRHCSLHGLFDDANHDLTQRERASAGARRLATRTSRRSIDQRINRLSEEDSVFITARLLWDARVLVPGVDRMARALRKKLENAPRVLGLVGSSLPEDPEALFELLRLKLDLYEVRPGAWAVKIEAIKRWLESAARLTPGQRGVGSKTGKMLAHATHLALVHRVSRKDMPLAMGVSEESFEMLLARSPKRPDALALKSAWFESRGPRSREERLEAELHSHPRLLRPKFGAERVPFVTVNEDGDLIFGGEGEPPIQHTSTLFPVWPTCGCPVSADDKRRVNAFLRLSEEFLQAPDDVESLTALRRQAIEHGLLGCAYRLRLRIRKLRLGAEREVDETTVRLLALAG